MIRTRSPIANCSLVGRRLVDHDVVRPRAEGPPRRSRSGLRSASSDQPKPSAGGPWTPAGLPSVPDDLGGSRNRSLDRPHAVDGLIRQQAKWARGWRSASETVFTPRTWTATPWLAVSKTAVESRVDRVAEDEGARRRSQRRVRQRATSGRAGACSRAGCGGPAGRSCPRPRRDRLHPIENRVRRRLVISSTIRPSARNTTRSAQLAAVGSWVTITMVWPNSSAARRMRPRARRRLRVELAGRLVREDDRPGERRAPAQQPPAAAGPPRAPSADA